MYYWDWDGDDLVNTEEDIQTDDEYSTYMGREIDLEEKED